MAFGHKTGGRTRGTLNHREFVLSFEHEKLYLEMA